MGAAVCGSSAVSAHRLARSRAFIISPRALSCCTAPWFEETRQTIRNWSAGGARDSVLAMRWDQETGKLSQVAGRDVPQLAVLIRSLLDMRRPEEADDNLRRMLDVLVAVIWRCFRHGSTRIKSISRIGNEYGE